MDEELGFFFGGASFAIFSQQKKLRSVNFSSVNSANLDFLEKIIKNGFFFY